MSGVNGIMYDIVSMMIEKGADDWDPGLYRECYRGHKEIVLMMIEKGANGLNEGL